jgi:hypothetical protein
MRPDRRSAQGDLQRVEKEAGDNGGLGDVEREKPPQASKADARDQARDRDGIAQGAVHRGRSEVHSGQPEDRGNQFQRAHTAYASDPAQQGSFRRWVHWLKPLRCRHFVFRGV